MRPDEEMEKRINDGERKHVEAEATRLLAWMLEQPWTREECLAMLARAWVQIDRTVRFADVAAGLLRQHNIIDQQVADMQENEPGRIGRLVELLELDIPSAQTKALSVAIKAGKKEVPASGGDGTKKQKERRQGLAFQWLEAHLRKKEGGGWSRSINWAALKLEEHMGRVAKEQDDKKLAVKTETCRAYVKAWMDRKGVEG